MHSWEKIALFFLIIALSSFVLVHQSIFLCGNYDNITKHIHVSW